MPRIALLVGRHLHYIEDYARYPGANERGIAEIRTRQGLKQEQSACQEEALMIRGTIIAMTALVIVYVIG